MGSHFPRNPAETAARNPLPAQSAERQGERLEPALGGDPEGRGTIRGAKDNPVPGLSQPPGQEEGLPGASAQIAGTRNVENAQRIHVPIR